MDPALRIQHFISLHLAAKQIVARRVKWKHFFETAPLYQFILFFETKNVLTVFVVLLKWLRLLKFLSKVISFR
jgi:hypothetical protein